MAAPEGAAKFREETPRKGGGIAERSSQCRAATICTLTSAVASFFDLFSNRIVGGKATFFGKVGPKLRQLVPIRLSIVQRKKFSEIYLPDSESQFCRCGATKES
jgi:hypothetical protein